ncbi:MAG: hypothetical protein HOO99_04355 [Hyphomicrobiaceae bacterium]|nr:hypothetical protein [Hyphomicrobiaceae bacterium]
MKTALNIHNLVPTKTPDQPEPAPIAHTFLNDIKIDHGPRQLLGQFFLRADSAVRRRGVTLSFAPIEELVAVNVQNQASWGMFAQTLDSRHGKIASQDSYCLLGTNDKGEVVAAQAGRLYRLHDRSLKDIADDASLYYGDAPRPLNAISCSMTAPSAATISGFVVYSGALWVRPDFRGQKLATLLPRISRAFALAHWGTDYTIAFMSPQIVASALSVQYGYKNIEPSYQVHQHGRVIFEGCLAWMTAETLAEDLFEFSSTLISEVD